MGDFVSGKIKTKFPAFQQRMGFKSSQDRLWSSCLDSTSSYNIFHRATFNEGGGLMCGWVGGRQEKKSIH